jgi:antirestriction protein
MATATASECRIYVASLSDYNAGCLHGVWIDLDGKGEDEVFEEINAMLKASREPGAEEFAIHDSEFPETFASLVNEYTPISEIVKLAEQAAEVDDAEVYGLLRNDFRLDHDDAVEILGNGYSTYDNEEDYGQQLADGIYSEKDLGPLANYIDYAAFGRDALMGEEMHTEHNGRIYVFRR